LSVLTPAAIELDDFLVEWREGGREGGTAGERGEERSFDFYKGELNETIGSLVRETEKGKKQEGRRGRRASGA